MPFSSDTFNDYIDGLIGMLKPRTLLDVGPGTGKYGKMVRKLVPDCRTTAYEIDESYVKNYQLNRIYDEMIVGDAASILNRPRLRFDLVMMGDVIEHMRKSVGVDLLNFLVYRSGYICVVYPEKYIQDDWEGHAAEAHISTWCPDDFKGWDTIHVPWGQMHLYLIKGYQPSLMTVIHKISKSSVVAGQVGDVEEPWRAGDTLRPPVA